MNETIKQKLSGMKILSGNGLKMIAIVTMLIDHIGASLIEVSILNLKRIPFYWISDSPEKMFLWEMDRVFRLIGRVAFPIFCFLLVEGFLHTKDVKKYAVRLFAFALISEIPFDLALFGEWFALQYQNVYFTLLLGLLAMVGIQKAGTNLWKSAASVIVCCGAAFLLKSDYDVFGVFLIVLLYVLRNRPVHRTVFGCIAVGWEITAPLAFIPINMYNGTRGKWNLKYLFYAFYPLHLLLLYGAGLLLACEK